jgi:hypothetical protein
VFQLFFIDCSKKRTDFLKLTTYLIFFVIIITFYGLPLNIVRDVYITARSFWTRLTALRRYQTATRNMDQRYASATAEELTVMSDRTCIICREEMVLQSVQDPPPDGPNTTPKKLPCGHIFHFYCLRSWLERQQSCPTWYVDVMPRHLVIHIFSVAEMFSTTLILRPQLRAGRLVCLLKVKTHKVFSVSSTAFLDLLHELGTLDKPDKPYKDSTMLKVK